MISDFLKGIFSYADAVSFITRNDLRRYYLYSGGIGLLIVALIVLMWIYLSPLTSVWVQSAISSNVGWINKTIEIVIWVGLLVLLFIVYKYLVLIITSPIMSRLSEEVESKLINDYVPTPMTFAKGVRDIARSTRIAIRNIFKELLYTILILLLGILPVTTIATAPFLLVLQGYFAGFGNMDFYLERYFNVKDTIAFVERRRALASGNGLVYVFILAIPLIGVFFAPVLGTVSATLEVHKILHDSEEK